MSEENVEVIRHAIEHLSDTGKLAEECYDPEVEYRTQPDAPMHTTYQGLQGLQRSLESLREVWDSMRIEAREFIGPAQRSSPSKPPGCGSRRCRRRTWRSSKRLTTPSTAGDFDAVLARLRLRGAIDRSNSSGLMRQIYRGHRGV